ncbi:protein LNK2-like isoform X1 [Zingiber officinale]|uniref:protein LNK2-like isoform X1 n=1 Tax=Zingiber officinale TaxID=94328 RepID=UPI001C4C1ECC|nr:protein LNK2-like isoform X1 [Zingiber officinale]
MRRVLPSAPWFTVSSKGERRQAGSCDSAVGFVFSDTGSAGTADWIWGRPSLVARRMFDWDDDQDQIGNTMWCEFSENEANIMPYPNGADKNPLPPLGNYKRKKNDEANTSLRSSEHSSGSKNDILGINQDNSSTFITSEELVAAQLDVDSWPDLPSLSASLSKEYNDSCNRDAMEAQLMLDISGTKKLDKIRVQFDSPSEIFNNDKDDEENGTFLDCDWANIGDIEDLDNIFSGNDSIFGHEMVGNVDEFLTATSDVISSTVQSIALPDMPLCKEQPSGYDSSSFHLDELSTGKEALEEKRGDSTVRTRREYYEEQNLFSNQPNIQKRTLTSHKKSEEKGKCKELDDTSAMWSCSTNESRQLLSSTTDACTKTVMDSFESSTERQVRAPEDVEQLDSPNQFMLSGYAYTAYPFPTIPISQNVYTKTNQEKTLSVGHKLLADFSKRPNGLSRLSDSASRPLTPQEKIEKLRRRQKMQAMLAIQQQQQQFAHPSTSDSGVPQSCSPKKQPVESRTNSAADLISNKHFPAERNILADQEEPWTISSIIDGQSLEETIYYQLQDAIEQLDGRIRLCIRDSLFRLAQSAMERQSSSDRNSTNKSDRDEDELSAYDDTKKSCKNSKWTSVETGTNPIDRTVAHLLFHRPSELSTRAVKEEIPQSPALYNPASDASLQAQACISNDHMENAREMERQPSKQMNR